MPDFGLVHALVLIGLVALVLLVVVLVLFVVRLSRR